MLFIQTTSTTSPTTPVDDETTAVASSDEAQTTVTSSTSTSPSKKASRHKRKDSIGKIVIDANCKAAAIQNQVPYRPNKLDCFTTQLEMLTSDKHSNLLGQFLSYTEIKVL